MGRQKQVDALVLRQRRRAEIADRFDKQTRIKLNEIHEQVITEFVIREVDSAVASTLEWILDAGTKELDAPAEGRVLSIDPVLVQGRWKSLCEQLAAWNK